MNYVICTTQRSGSTLFSKTLSGTGFLGKPSEKLLYLEQGYENMSKLNKEYSKLPIEDALKRIKLEQSSDNGVFGIKLMWSTMNRLIGGDNVHENCHLGLQKLIENWGDTQFVFWRRRDKIKQAVSHAVMRKIGQAHAQTSIELKEISARTSNLSISNSYIENNLYRLFEHELEWKHFFLRNKIKVKTIYFEDFLINKEKVIKEFSDLLGVKFELERIEEAPPLLKVSNEATAKLERDFREYISSAMNRRQLELYDC